MYVIIGIWVMGFVVMLINIYDIEYEVIFLIFLFIIW